MQDKKTVRLNVRMTEAQFSALKEVATERNNTISNLVRMGIEWTVQRFGNGKENREVEQGQKQTESEV
jgi:hypothetical protein